MVAADGNLGGHDFLLFNGAILCDYLREASLCRPRSVIHLNSPPGFRPAERVAAQVYSPRGVCDIGDAALQRPETGGESFLVAKSCLLGARNFGMLLSDG